MSELVIGSRVFHRGYTDFKVVNLQKHHRGVIATFENERYKVKCNAAELRSEDKDGVVVFYLPGRTKKMPGELSTEQAIAFGMEKGNLSVEGAERKLKKFEKRIEAERIEEAKRLEAKKLEEERIKSDG